MQDIIPAHARKRVYAWFGVLGLIIGAVQVGYLSAGAGQPVWLTVALAVYPFVGAGIGYTARANVTPDTVTAEGSDSRDL